MGIGSRGIAAFCHAHPERKPLIGMGAATLLFSSLIPISAFNHSGRRKRMTNLSVLP
jgi:hypothetical protein